MCGTELTITGRKATVTEVPRTKLPGTAKERIEALRAMGMDVSHLFAMQGANGGECIASNKDGHLTMLDDDDPLFKLITGQGDVPNRRLFRRWVMAQMFHMMTCTDYRSGNVAVLTTDNILKVYDGTTGALLTDVEAAPVEEAQYISVTALPDGYALLQYNDENYDILAIQTYGGEGLLWSSAGEAQQYTYASYLTNTANGPLLTAHRDNSDSSNLSDVLDMEGNLLLRRLGSCYSIDDLPDDCFIARQGFDYGLMDSTGQWLYRESIFSSPSDDAGGGYLY